MSWGGVINQGSKDILSILFDNHQNNMQDFFADSCPIKPDMLALKNFWASLLTRPSSPRDPHAIANLIGPFLLMHDLAGYKGDIQLQALRTLMESVGLVPQGNKENKPGINRQWIDWNQHKIDELLEGNQTINLLLIDDMWQSGWGRLLCHAVGATYDEKASIYEQALRKLG